MAIKIAGRDVKVGDNLYHFKAGVWGQVTGFDPSGAALLQILIPPYNTRTLFVQNGGLINGVRAIYWHEPLAVDLPRSDISTLQSLVDTIADALYPAGGQ